MALEKKLYDLKEVRQIIPGISQASLYNACKRGEIPSVRIGGRIFIPAWWVKKVTHEPDESEQQNYTAKF